MSQVSARSGNMAALREKKLDLKTPENPENELSPTLVKHEFHTFIPFCLCQDMVGFLN